MKNKILILCTIGMLLSLTGCFMSSTDNRKNKIKETANLNDDLTYLAGTWSNSNLSPEEINKLGGSYLVIEVSDDNQLSGKYVSVQETSQRIAMVEFSVLNEKNKYTLQYDDDGFGNSGSMKIVIGKESIGVEIIDVTLSEDNTSGWGLVSSKLKKYSDSIEDAKPVKDIETKDNSNTGDDIETENSSNTLENTKSGGRISPLDEDDKNTLKNAFNLDIKDMELEVSNYRESLGKLDVGYYEPIFESDLRDYTEDELMKFSKELIYIFRNEIYARHGLIFKNEDLNNYFKKYSWYQGTYTMDEFNSSVFNDYEIRNLKLALEVEENLGY